MGETPTQSSGSETTGPATFQGMSWSDAPSASTPTSDTTAASASADTTVPPAGTPSPDGTTPAPGEPPRERWDKILANQRTEAAQKRLDELGLGSFAPDQLQRIAPMLSRALSDPEGFLVSELLDHPNGVDILQTALSRMQGHTTHGATVKSLIGRAMAQLKQQSQAPAEPQMVNVQLEDGSVVAMPRDPAAWLAHQKQQWQDEMRQELQPVTQTVQTLQQREAAAQRQIQIDHFVTTTHTDALTWPGMDKPEAQKAVASELAQARIDANDPREVTLALNAAYRKVVLPTLGSQAEAKLLDSLKTKAQASTSVNPGSSAPSAPQSVTRFTQLGPEAWR